MNYSEPRLLRLLAERYVLGTMKRRARRRFSRLLDADDSVVRSVVAVEETLLPLAWSLDPVTPSELVWRRIARAIRRGAATVPKAPGDSGVMAPRSTPLWLTAAMSLAIIVSSIGWWQALNKPPEVVTETIVETVPVTPSIGIVPDASGRALWLARIYPVQERAEIFVQNDPEQKSNNDYELWILRDDGVPVSLGLLPQSGERILSLDSDAVAGLAQGSTLAVSLEPLGGSPEAAPTGPVLYTAALLAP